MSETLEFVTVGEKKYAVIKTGRAQAEQVLGLTRWIYQHGKKAMSGMTVDADDSADTTGIEFLGRLVSGLDTDALIDLFTVLIGCPREDSEVYFDVALLVDVVTEVYERNQSLRRLVERFFSSSNSKDNSEDISTQSE